MFWRCAVLYLEPNPRPMIDHELGYTRKTTFVSSVISLTKDYGHVLRKEHQRTMDNQSPERKDSKSVYR